MINREGSRTVVAQQAVARPARDGGVGSAGLDDVGKGRHRVDALPLSIVMDLLVRCAGVQAVLRARWSELERGRNLDGACSLVLGAVSESAPPGLDELAENPGRARDLSAEMVIVLMAKCAALQSGLAARLAGGQVAERTTDKQDDHLLTADEAAEILGVTRRWLYRQAASLPFTRRLRARTLRFSEPGLKKWMDSRRSC